MSIGPIINVRSAIISWETGEYGSSNWCELEKDMRVGKKKSQQLKKPLVSTTSTYSTVESPCI